MKKILYIVFSPVLWVLSVVYYIGVMIVRYFKLRKQKQLPAKIICIGNITVGGTGKTSAVIQLAREFAKKRCRVAVLSRGYKRKTKDIKKSLPVVVSDGKDILVPIEVAGDEPFMIARELPGIPVIICQDRYTAGLFAINRFNSEILLMDDGFQHWKLFRNLDVVLVDALNPFGGGYLLPLGLLREPLNAFRRADVILITNIEFTENARINNIINKIRRYNPGLNIIRTSYRSIVLERLFTREKVSLSWLKGKDVTIVSGIGNPYSFELTVLSLGVKLVKKMRFPDHYWYTASDIQRITENKTVMTTEKDAVRIESVKDVNVPADTDMFMLRAELQPVESEDSWQEKVMERLEYSSTETAR